jgi:hypothetical protein
LSPPRGGLCTLHRPVQLVGHADGWTSDITAHGAIHPAPAQLFQSCSTSCCACSSNELLSASTMPSASLRWLSSRGAQQRSASMPAPLLSAAPAAPAAPAAATAAPAASPPHHPQASGPLVAAHDHPPAAACLMMHGSPQPAAGAAARPCWLHWHAAQLGCTGRHIISTVYGLCTACVWSVCGLRHRHGAAVVSCPARSQNHAGHRDMQQQQGWGGRQVKQANHAAWTSCVGDAVGHL